MKQAFLVICAAALFLAPVLGFNSIFPQGRHTLALNAVTPNQASPDQVPLASSIARREFVSTVAGAAVVGTFGALVSAEEAATIPEVSRNINRMGGLLEPNTEPGCPFKLFKPSNWNYFSGAGSEGAYDAKWVDIVNPDSVIVTSSPVKSTTTSVTALGDVKAFGEKLAAKRGCELVEATARNTEGIDMYQFEFQYSGGNEKREIYLLSVNKGKLWALTCTSISKRWSKRRELYMNLAGSFVPKL